MMNARKMKRRIYKRHAHTLLMRRLGKQLAAQLIASDMQRVMRAILINVIQPFIDLIHPIGEAIALGLLDVAPGRDRFALGLFDATAGRVTSFPPCKAPVGFFGNGISGVWPIQPEAEPCSKPT